MKFDHDDRDLDYLHNDTRQISQPRTDKYGVYVPKSREKVKHQKNHKRFITFGLILSEILIVLIISLYFISPLNRVNHVTVKGNHTIMKRSVEKDVKSEPGDSVTRLLVHRNYLEHVAFKRNVQLRSIRLNDHDWNHIVINVTEYPIIAYIQRGHKYYAMSNNGKYARQATTPNQVYPLLFNFRSSRVLELFAKSYKLIPSSIKPDINKIYYSPTKIDPDRVHIYMSDGNQVYANLNNWARKMKYYSAISRSMKKRGVVNLELGAYSRAFTKSSHRR